MFEFCLEKSPNAPACRITRQQHVTRTMPDGTGKRFCRITQEEHARLRPIEDGSQVRPLVGKAVEEASHTPSGVGAKPWH